MSTLTQHCSSEHESRSHPLRPHDDRTSVCDFFFFLFLIVVIVSFNVRCVLKSVVYAVGYHIVVFSDCSDCQCICWGTDRLRHFTYFLLLVSVVGQQLLLYFLLLGESEPPQAHRLDEDASATVLASSEYEFHGCDHVKTKVSEVNVNE